MRKPQAGAPDCATEVESPNHAGAFCGRLPPRSAVNFGAQVVLSVAVTRRAEFTAEMLIGFPAYACIVDTVETSQIPPLEKIIHLAFMYHETRAFEAHGNAEKAALLRAEESTLYHCHGVDREIVQQYAAAYDRGTVLSFFRNDADYLELEKAFARAPQEKFEILARVTSFAPPTRIENKHVRTIPVAEYRRITAELNSLLREHRRN